MHRHRFARKITALLSCVIVLGTARGLAGAADMSSVATVPKPVPGGEPWSQAQVAALQRSLQALLAASALRGAQVGFLAIDTVRGTALYSQNADQEFMPASNFKLLVGSTILRRLGLNFSYVTTVAADGPVRGGVLHGNLYLHGGGDALLRATDLEDAAAAVAQQGIKRIDGALVTDASHFDSQRLGFGWSWDDLPFYYAPVESALELEDGVVHIYMTPGKTVGSPVTLRVEPQSTVFTIDNRLTTGPAKSEDTSNIVRPWNAPQTIELTGSYPLGAKESGDIAATVPDPESYAGDVFARSLSDHGITVAQDVRNGTTPRGAAVLWSHASEPMPQLLADFWYPSDNLMGELFLKQLGVVQSGEPGTDANGVIAEQQFLHSIGVNPDSVSITDGSGLSQYDRITPDDLVAILQADWNSSYRDVVLNALPVSGVRGTLKGAYAGTPAAGMVFAKTGSISHVRTMSGFVRTRTHGPITFSFLVNEWMGEDQPNGSAELAKVRSAVFNLLVAQ